MASTNSPHLSHGRLSLRSRPRVGGSVTTANNHAGPMNKRGAAPSPTANDESPAPLSAYPQHGEYYFEDGNITFLVRLKCAHLVE